MADDRSHVDLDDGAYSSWGWKFGPVSERKVVRSVDSQIKQCATHKRLNPLSHSFVSSGLYYLSDVSNLQLADHADMPTLNLDLRQELIVFQAPEVDGVRKNHNRHPPASFLIHPLRCRARR